MTVSFNRKVCGAKGRLCLGASIIAIIGLFSCQQLPATQPEDAGVAAIDSRPDPGGDADPGADVEPIEPSAEPGLNAVYFNEMDLTDQALARIDPTVDFDWGQGSPDPQIDPHTFSARWIGSIKPRYTETHTFTTASDDGVRLWIGNELVINNWSEHSVEEDSGTISLEAGELYNITLEYFDNTEDAVIRLYWSSASQPNEIVPSSNLFTEYDDTQPPPAPPPPSQGRESYDGPWGGEHVELRDVWEENWSEGLSSREKYLLVSNNDCSQSSVEERAQTNGFSVLAQEGDNDSGATLLEVQGDSEKDGLKAILDVGKITITAVTTDGTLIHDGGGEQDGEDEERQAFGSTDNTNTGGGVYHLDINANEDGVTIWDRDHPCESFRGGFMYLRWE